ncbi:MAG TPA: carbonic anhydrase [Gemmataceae bacterium]|nr:carbonic anhydrase [Gemmataceae bacterium]
MARHLSIVACIYVLVFCPSLLLADEPKVGKVTPDVALKRLQDGNARFVADQLLPRDPYPLQRAKTANSQHPFAVILTCADSRVGPELVFNQQLGDVFVVRVAGNVTSPDITGSIEYAVEHLGPTLVVVLGHSSCGAVETALSGAKLEGNLQTLVKHVDVGKDLPMDKAAALNAGIRNNVLHQMEHLTRDSSVLKEFVATQRIRIVGGVYSLASGKVEWLEAPASKPGPGPEKK